jgi:hypothetical protein
VPQIGDGLLPLPGLVTVKVSVRQFVANEEATPNVVLIDPAKFLKLELVSVLGPVITKVVMSMRSWKLTFS